MWNQLYGLPRQVDLRLQVLQHQAQDYADGKTQHEDENRVDYGHFTGAVVVELAERVLDISFN